MPPPPAAHGTPNRWRTGCRCTECRDAHVVDSRDTRRRASDVRLPAATRRLILGRLRRGDSPAAAAERADIPVQRIWGYARAHPEWLAQVDEALMAGRSDEVPHGTASGYRHYGCRCPECRAVHHPAAVG